jgi:GR25 family glycosyltransferase involved in LPS biosynthesis
MVAPQHTPSLLRPNTAAYRTDQAIQGSATIMSPTINSIYYINLADATERRAAIEEELRKTSKPGLNVFRVEATDTRYIEKNNIAGSIRSGEKACFLSHLRTIEWSLNSPGHSLILEDDALLCERTINILNALLTKLDDIDITFTDLCVPSPQSMWQLFRLRRESIERQQVSLIDTRDIDFAGATAYVLSDKSKRLLLAILKSIRSFDVPYDLVLRNLIITGKITSRFVFPFITTLSPQAANTHIQMERDRLNNIAWNAFRESMFLENDASTRSALKEIDQLSADFYDEEANSFASILRVMLARNFTQTTVRGEPLPARNP